ncbi:hypothetical protein ACM2TW_24155, partial [Escherichia coli]
NTDDLFVGKTLLHGDVLMWLMKTLLTSGCTNQRGAGQRHSWNYMYSKGIEGAELEYSRRKDLRNYLMGWSKESIMCDRYNFKYISQQEKDVVLKVYKSVSKIISEV